MDYPIEELSQYQIEAVNKFNNNSEIEFEKVSCLNCDSENHKILFINDRYGFNLTTVLCKKCGLIFSNPRMSKNSTDFFYNSDLYRQIYDSGKDKEIKEYAESKFQIIFSLYNF